MLRISLEPRYFSVSTKNQLDQPQTSANGRKWIMYALDNSRPRTRLLMFEPTRLLFQNIFGPTTREMHAAHRFKRPAYPEISPRYLVGQIFEIHTFFLQPDMTNNILQDSSAECGVRSAGCEGSSELCGITEIISYRGHTFHHISTAACADVTQIK